MWDKRFLELARLVASWSKDPSTQTGAVIVRPDKAVVSVGFNGFPKWMEDKPEWLNNREEKYSRIVHCEINALIHAARDVEGCTLYTVPFFSCERCCVQMIQAGIVRFVAPALAEDKRERWAEPLAKTKRYIEECGLEWKEL